MQPDAERALRAVAVQLEATSEDLHVLADTLESSTVPLVADFVDDALQLLSGRTLETYRPQVTRLADLLGHKRLDDVTLLDLEAAAVAARQAALANCRSRQGFGAQESFVSAARFVFACAVKAGHVRASPAAELGRPRRRRSNRRALSATELLQLFDAVLATSRDPELDLLILAFARETACRREGVLNLGVADLQSTPSVMLYEKFEERSEIPVSGPLLRALQAHHARRAPACPKVFHYVDGRYLTDRRFDSMFTRAGRALPWVRSLGVTLHWLRYSTLTDIRMTSGERVAAAYAGHGDGVGGVTAAYTRATFAELQEAHRRLFLSESSLEGSSG